MRVTPDPSGEIVPPERVRGRGFYLAIFGIGILLSFGLCGLSTRLQDGDGSPLGLFAFVLGLCCFLGFILTLLAGLISWIRR